MKIAMVFGTFDNLHPGHLDFFRQARKLGDKLYVVVARDANVLKFKKRLPKNNEKERHAQLSVANLVDKVIMGDNQIKYGPIKKYQPDIICVGYDQKADIDKLNKLFPKIKIYRLKPFKEKIYKSSLIK